MFSPDLDNSCVYENQWPIFKGKIGTHQKFTFISLFIYFAHCPACPYSIAVQYAIIGQIVLAAEAKKIRYNPHYTHNIIV